MASHPQRYLFSHKFRGIDLRVRNVLGYDLLAHSKVVVKVMPAFAVKILKCLPPRSVSEPYFFEQTSGFKRVWQECKSHEPGTNFGAKIGS